MRKNKDVMKNLVSKNERRENAQSKKKKKKKDKNWIFLFHEKYIYKTIDFSSKVW